MMLLRAFVLALLINQTLSCTVDANAKSNFPVIQNSITTTDKDKFFNIGGLFDMHRAGSKYGECGKARQNGLQHVAAFLWAIETVKKRNSKTDLLKNIEIGAIAFDTCSSIDKLVQHTLNFRMCTASYGNPPVQPQDTYGFVGPDSITALGKALPIITGGDMIEFGICTGHPSLSGISPYFNRVAPTEDHLFEALVKALSNLEWKVVQLVYSDEYGGQESVDYFEKVAKAAGICTEQILHYSEAKKSNVVKSILARKSVRAVVLLLETDEILQFIDAAKDGNVPSDTFTWMATSNWIPNPDFIHSKANDIARGAIGIGPRIDDLLGNTPMQEYMTYFRELKPANKDWLTNFWQEYFQCNLQGGTKYSRVCDVINKDNFKSAEIDPSVIYTIQAVDSMAIGMDSAIKSKCASGKICADLRSANGRQIVANHVREAKHKGVSFNASSGDNRDIYVNYWMFDGSKYNDIGYYLRVLGSSGEQKDEWNPPSSIGPLNSECDKSCTVCSKDNKPITKSTPLPMVTTSAGSGGNSSRIQKYTVIRKEEWVIPLIILACLGMFIVLVFEVYLLSKMMGTEMIKSFRTMWLGQVLLLAIFLCYLVCLAFAFHPTVENCAIQRFGIGGTYSMCFSVLLVKLMIIFSSRSIGYLKGVYQVLMFSFCWSVQVVIDSEWLVLRLPGIVEIDGRVFCNHNYLSHIQSLVYVMFLIFVCTILSVRAHGIITNHREGIFIGLSAGFSIPIWIAWTLVGSFNKSKDFEDPTIAFGLLINATLILFCMFLPKVRQLNNLGVEAIYLEDDNEREVYGSVIYGAPQDLGKGSVYLNGGGALSYYPESVTRADPVLLKAHSDYIPAVAGTVNVDALHLKHPGSIMSAPAYGGTMQRYAENGYGTVNGRVLRVTGDLTGKGPFDSKKAQSEIGYSEVKKQRSSRATLKHSGSLTDLGAL